MLPFRPPLDWPALLAFLRPRAIPGLERVDASTYRRGDLTIGLAPQGGALLLDAPAVDSEDALRRARHLFDLDADSAPIEAHLAADPILRIRPGLRVPGCWDAFELLVRAIVGQQVSVKGASTLLGRLHAAFGIAPQSLACADLAGIGLTRSRSATLQAAARAVLDGGLAFDSAAPLPTIRGIGPWTAQYVAMRALKHRDAFPAEDLILRRAASADGVPLSARQLAARAEPWRPYRAYAVMALWRAYSERPG